MFLARGSLQALRLWSRGRLPCVSNPLCLSLVRTLDTGLRMNQEGGVRVTPSLRSGNGRTGGSSLKEEEAKFTLNLRSHPR